MTIQTGFELISSQILPEGNFFTDQQKDAIVADGSVNVVAGPGSGKTTVLIAKYALLLRQRSDINKGICLITHTNVAVDEIKIGLKRIGISNIQYPNFIGTIQEFFNTFFARKAFNLVQKEKNFRVVDDEEYSEKFNELFQRNKPVWYTYSSPSINKANPKLLISQDFSFKVSSSANHSYKVVFEKSIETLFNWGIINNHQCLELSKWYIERYKEQIKKAISTRFNYVLLDEAQDTSHLQYDLLKSLFSNTNVFFQRFGDPYQALYSIFEGNNDAWIPSKEMEIPYLEISQTSRFGSNIVNVIKNICIEKYENFESLNIIQSFSPYLIIYDSEEELVEKYRGLINFCKEESKTFLLSKKKDAILSAFHEDLGKQFSSYVKPTINPRKNEGQIKKIYNFLLSILLKDIDLSFKELKDNIDASLNCKTKISICIKEFTNESFQVDVVINYLEEVLATLTNNKIVKLSIMDVENKVNYFRQLVLTNELDQFSTEEIEFYIGTIHSVKGETHRSTLLVLDTIFMDYSRNPPTEFKVFDLLKDYLFGHFTDPYAITDSIKRNETIKSLKLAYVALSRPTHLAAIAIPSKIITKDDRILEMFYKNGWIRYEKEVEHFV